MAESEHQRIRLLALMAQAEHGNFDGRTHQMNIYKTMIGEICEPTPELIHQIVDAHTQLVGMSRETAQYKLLQEFAEFQNYGVQYHEATFGGDNIHVGIGPTGVVLHSTNNEMIEK